MDGLDEAEERILRSSVVRMLRDGKELASCRSVLASHVGAREHGEKWIPWGHQHASPERLLK